jgi:hypothetical protein
MSKAVGPMSRMRAVGIVVISAVMMLGARVMSADRPGIVPGEQRRWALDFLVRLEQPGLDQPVAIELSGDLVATISALREGEYDVALEVVNARIKSDGFGKQSPQAIEQVQQRLARRFWATYRDDGSLLGIHFFNDVDPGDRNLLQMIATEVQLVRRDASEMVWNALERDGAGTYLAIYNWADPHSVIKRKVKYVRPDAEPGAPTDGLRLVVEQSELRFRFDHDGEISTLEASERVRMGVLPDKSGDLVAVTTTRLTHLQRGKAPELIDSLAHAGSNVLSSPILTHRSDPEKLRARLDDQLLEGHTSESLLEAATSKASEDPEIASRLAAMFRRRPNSIPEALALLRKTGRQKRITDALGAAGAVGALGSLAGSAAVATPVRIDALTAMVLVQSPSLEAMRISAALLDDPDVQVASAARILGGAVARAGRRDHPSEANAIDSALIVRYRSAGEVRDISDLLAAFGNSVGPSVLPVIESALHDARALVRAAAARALRLAEAPEVDRLLSALITGDSDPHVRADAIFASSFRRPSAAVFEALQQAARGDPAEHVRSNAVSLLRQHPDACPGIPDTLAWIAQHDTKPGVRRLANEALASIEAARGGAGAVTPFQ